ncbi:poly(ethylene terephthalate) hydrolase family protein [Paenibacillus wenxiniae]|uniref:Alpha/beta hydrolase n=1 Tax=Paenibacillus wenxiniae TaxID=1636843 RepID=A0ABW4RKY3_9BACL
MKRLLKILLTIFISLVVIIAGLWAFISYRSSHYFDFVTTDKPIEAKYTAPGPHEVSYVEFDADNVVFKNYDVWYPSDIKQSTSPVPLIVIANGTGSTALTYKAIFKHLASWGFIVVGNADENSRTGASSAASLNFMLRLNQDQQSNFYGKIDTDHIGITGHSQGGVAVINAVTQQQNGHYYKAMFTASATSSFWGQKNQLGEDWSYDVTKVNIPYFMVAGTGAFDAGTATDISAQKGQGIAPLWSLNTNYAHIPDSVTKVMARRVHADHGDMMTHADAYMIAWFMYWLQNDQQAGNAFFGKNAEILTNANWQNIRKNN